MRHKGTVIQVPYVPAANGGLGLGLAPSSRQACRRVRGPTPAEAIHPDNHRTAPQCLKGGAEWGLTAFPVSFGTQVASLLMSDAEELYSMERCHNRAPCGRTDAGPALRTHPPPKPQRTK